VRHLHVLYAAEGPPSIRNLPRPTPPVEMITRVEVIDKFNQNYPRKPSDCLQESSEGRAFREFLEVTLNDILNFVAEENAALRVRLHVLESNYRSSL
jgi:hypothetical protein